MKKIMKSVLSALLSLVLLLTLAAPAQAAGATITYRGKLKGFGFKPGSEYSTTDLFTEFKNVLPGDKLTETIEIRNRSMDGDYIKLYLRAKPHDATKNPMSPVVDELNKSDIAYMEDFLAQLTMEVYYGNKKIYSATADQVDGLKKNVYLGTIRRNREAELTVNLQVPIGMGNDYAERVGEIDWVFTADTFNDPPLIQTGQLNWPIPVLFGTGLVMMLAGLLLIFKKRKNEYA